MLISCTVTVQLICTFVFAYAKRRLSHSAAHIASSYFQGQGTIEYVIEAPNLSEMTSWLMELKTCISPEPPPDTQQEDEVSPTMYVHVI